LSHCAGSLQFFVRRLLFALRSSQLKSREVPVSAGG
jgi:hypothetical protein